MNEYGKNNRRSERSGRENKGFCGSYYYQRGRTKCSADCFWESSVRGGSAVDGCLYEEDRGKHKSESSGCDLCLGYGYTGRVSVKRQCQDRNFGEHL